MLLRFPLLTSVYLKESTGVDFVDFLDLDLRPSSIGCEALVVLISNKYSSF